MNLSRSFNSKMFLLLCTKKTVTAVSVASSRKFLLQGYALASQLGHSIVDPVPSLFTFKIEDLHLRELSGVSGDWNLCLLNKAVSAICYVTFSKVKVRLKLDSVRKNIPQLTQVGPMLVTHWGVSGPAILRLSAWGARNLFSSAYKGSYFAIDMCLGSLILFIWQKLNKANADAFGSAVASCLICGDGIWTLQVEKLRKLKSLSQV
ncbi:hypothetical protein RIF29_38912 [Crotalaria pallida]|uniref:RsdA/BaiN/AoA(So)-like insert domain-containing protein n=1 Tax=Crotalaria pallida TaxID=3830 RepID=A0AAN9HP67_CROPI